VEIERLVHRLGGLELSLAGDADPRTHELLARLGAATRHLRAARCALAGAAAQEHSAEPEHLQGSGRTVPVQDLMCFLATQRKSGVLRIQTERERYLLQLEDGALVYATGDAPPPGQGLGELLTALGVHSAELLGRLPEPAPGGGWNDPNLVGTSWIPQDELRQAVHRQTRLAFFRLCGARNTRFRFYEGAGIRNVVPVRQSAMELLLEHSHAQDERRGALAPCGGGAQPALVPQAR
jgi:hypothetical protein